MTHDPYTIVVALDKVQEAGGASTWTTARALTTRRKPSVHLVFKHYRLENDVYHNGLHERLHDGGEDRGEADQEDLGHRRGKDDHQVFWAQDKSGLWTLVIKKPGLSLTENWSLKMRGH